MKIVRLESDDSAVQSIFTNNLSIPVTLSKNGQVALKTLTIDFTLDNIVINETNNVLDVEFIGGDIYNVQLIKGVYSNTSLLEMLNNQFNKYLKSNLASSSALGFEWNINQDDNKKLVIGLGGEHIRSIYEYIRKNNICPDNEILK